MKFAWLLLALFSGTLGAELSSDGHGLGLKPMTAEQIEHLQNTWPRVIGVRPNKIGAMRIEENLKERGQSRPCFFVAQSPEEEFITVTGGNANPTATLMDVDVSALPRSVDNSKLPSFPPIGNQGQLGSCVGWASTYYHATHELGLLNGYNNKTSSTHILSPKWTYNNLNGGQDGGLAVEDAYEMLAQNGATSIVNFPYDSNYRAWDLNPQDWVSALSARMAPAQYINIGDPQNLNAVKQILNNGHNLTFATFVESWVFTSVGNDPSNPSNPYAGQAAVSYMNGYMGGHHISIVGYNDDIWIDINRNGVVEPGEKGAFLIANSWGPFWKNSGYVWVSYDAFYTNSTVGNMPGRIPIGDALNSNVVSVVPKTANYNPSLVAQFSLTQNYRNQIAISGGVSSTSQSTPSKTFTSKALNLEGGAYGFDGASATSATFALDMTDLLPSTSSTQRYYLNVRDSQSGNPTGVTAYSLLDRTLGSQVNCPQVPESVDGNTIRPYIDYDAGGNVPSPLSVTITSPANGATLSGTASITANASSSAGISHVDFYVDANLFSSDQTSPYMASLDTTKLSNGTHSLYAIAYDPANNQKTSSTVSVQVQNSSSTSIFVNAGGGAASYGGTSWSPDQYYTTPSNAYTSTLSFLNPVYKTERWGNFSYNFPVANGSHTVKLKFAEIWWTSAGKRIFDVTINGRKVLSNFDLYQVAGYGVPYDRMFLVNVTNNNIRIDFTPTVDNAKISAIAITTP